MLGMEQDESSEFAAGYGFCSRNHYTKHDQSVFFQLATILILFCWGYSATAHATNRPIPKKDSLQTRHSDHFCFSYDCVIHDDEDRNADREEDLNSDREADREGEGESHSRKSWRNAKINHRSECLSNNRRG
jgi:hypothetical protein